MDRPTTTTELMRAAAEALMARDANRLSGLRAIAQGWMQTSAEEQAQLMLLDAMGEAAELLEGEPTCLDADDYSPE